MCVDAALFPAGTCHAYVSPVINALYDAQTNPGKLFFLGPVGPTTGNIAIAARKEPDATRNSAASIAWGVGTLIAIIVAIIA